MKKKMIKEEYILTKFKEYFSKEYKQFEKRYEEEIALTNKVSKPKKPTLKYKEEWFETMDRRDFVQLLVKKYNMNPKTADRRYYDVKHLTPKIKVEQKKKKYDDDQKTPIDEWKNITLQDMIRMNMKLTREFMRRHGFLESEINYLIDEGRITLED